MPDFDYTGQCWTILYIILIKTHVGINCNKMDFARLYHTKIDINLSTQECIDYTGPYWKYGYYHVCAFYTDLF